MANDYRKLYKNYYGIDFDKNYEIHHIDLNHENNEISNLVLLPKKLHRKYHLYIYGYDDNHELKLNVEISGNCLSANTYNMSVIENVMEVLNECNKWYDYKLYLEGIMPNIHSISLENDYNADI